METVKFKYSGKEIDFRTLNDESVMINATQMANVFGKRVDVFLKTDHAKAFIASLLSTPIKEDNNNYSEPEEESTFDYSITIGEKEKKISTPYGVDKNNYSVAKGQNKITFKRDEIIKTTKRGGTWMHRILALKFAAWLDPYFEVWVYHAINNILFGNFKEQKEATEAKLIVERELKEKKQALLKSNPEFIEIVFLEKQLDKAKKRRRKAIVESTNQMKIELDSKKGD